MQSSQAGSDDLEFFRKSLSSLPAEFLLWVAGATLPLKLDQAQMDWLFPALSGHALLIAIGIISIAAIVVILRNQRLQTAGAGMLFMVIPGLFFTGIHPSGDRLFYSVSLFSVFFIIVAASEILLVIKSRSVLAVISMIFCAVLLTGVYHQSLLLNQNLKIRVNAGIWAEKMLRANVEYLRDNQAPESGMVFWAGTPVFFERIYVLGACLPETVNLRLSSSILKKVVQVSYLERKGGRTLQSFNPDFIPEILEDNDIIFYFDSHDAKLISRQEFKNMWKEGQRRLKIKE